METVLKRYLQQLKDSIPVVSRYEEELQSLNTWWGKIALLGKINSYNIAATILDDMEETKRKFGELQHKLIYHLTLEHLKKRVQDDASRSQVAIDILIRNLFERTADVGFLATDQDIRDFLNNPSPEREQVEALQQRLNEYVKKYSVYDEIVILSPDGEVRCHLNDENPISHCYDSLIEVTINTDEEYVETFRHSDIQPDKPTSLIYSCKITASNDPLSPLLGVLCLCFRFEDEMAGIFNNLLYKNDPSTIVLLNKDNAVISCSRPELVPIGSKLSVTDSPSINGYAGDQYLFNLTETQGYQGFYGLGWKGLVMTPLTHMAGGGSERNDLQLDDAILDASKLFSSDLKAIRKHSVDVNEDLGLVVLNGKITSARKEAQEFMPVLEAIKQIGTDISNIFRSSINSLQGTVVSSRLSDVQFLASLAVDIMDRNLYERANDCRWWALTSAFRKLLSQVSLSEQDRQEMGEILHYINDLYTVYTNLYLYDKQGTIVAVSNQDEASIIGSQLTEQSGALAALKLEDTQHYTVSPFIETPYYGGAHSYIYNAAVRDPDNGEQVVGGIGIVFDSTPQFTAMLEDTLPRNERGSLLEGAFALFCQRDGMIISQANHPTLKVGDTLGLPEDHLSLACGESTSMCLEFEGQHYTLGIAVSQGYREYKTTEDYTNDVIGLVFVPL